MTTHFGRVAYAVILALILAFAFAVGNATAADKVGICHATGSESNPYVFIVIAEQAAEAAHIDRDTGNLHGDQLGNVDFYAESEAECNTTPTPAPSSSPTLTPTPTVAPTATPTPTPTPNETDCISVVDGIVSGSIACGPLAACEYYSPGEYTVNGRTGETVQWPGGFAPDATEEPDADCFPTVSPTPEATPTPRATDTSTDEVPALPDTAMASQG